PMTPVIRYRFDLEAEISSHFRPERGKLSEVRCQNLVPGIERVDECRFPAARTRCRVNNHRIHRLENCLHPFKTVLCQYRELGTAMVNGRVVNCPEHSVRNIG